MNDLDKAQMMAPEGEFLAYINPKEAGILKALGGSGKMTAMGIPSFTEDEEDTGDVASTSYSGGNDYSSQDNEEQQARDAAAYSSGQRTNAFNDMYSDDSGQGGGNNFIQTIGNLYNRFSPVANIGRGIGFLGRGIGNLFDKFADLRGFNPDGSRRTQDEYEKDRQDRINQNRISNILGREAPFTQMTLDNLSRLGYDGPMGQDLIGTTNNMRTMNDPIFGPVTEGTIYDAEDPELGILSQAPDYNFRDAMREINLQPGFNARQNLGQQEAKSMMEEYYNTPIENRMANTSGYNVNDIRSAKTFGLEELLAAKAGETGFFGGLTDQGKALEQFRKEALGMNNPKNENFAPYKGLGAQFQLNQLIKNENKNAMENKNYIQEQINKGFLQNPEDFINQKPLGSYF